MPQLNIEFIADHKPSLESGEYKVTVKQSIEIKNQSPSQEPFKTEINLAVFGERFSLQPQEIYASFPPAGSLANWSTVLPHLVLSRSTLPWERSPIESKNDNDNTSTNKKPWLALLLFTKDEYQGEKPGVLPLQLLTLKELKERSQPSSHPSSESPSEPSLQSPQNIKLRDLAKNAIAPLSAELSEKLGNLKPEEDLDLGKTYFPTFELEKSQQEADPVIVTDVKKSLLQKILPSVNELDYLAHVRQTTNEEPIAVVIGNRLPKPNVSNTVYLVSLENRFDYQKAEFDYQEAKDDDYIRLVVLNSWQFTCIDLKQNFKDLLTHLNGYQNKSQDSQQFSTLRLPKPATENAELAEAYLSKGYVPLHHNLRQGGNTISWYHGPLIPACNQTKKELSSLSVYSADKLVCYNSGEGMFDVSYASAWELGRLLALQDSHFSMNLSNWKREHLKEVTENNQQELYSHLFPSSTVTTTDNELNNQPDSIKEKIDEWLKELALLKGVPFNYLVPDEQMLPQESIRFFHLDWFWVECLLDGAFSLGSGLGQKKVTNPDKLAENEDITGFLLRSQVISGWPDLQVEARSKLNPSNPMEDNQKLKLLRCDRLSESVLLCLFAGDIQTLDISLKPQGLHFGFDSTNHKLSRSLRNPETGEELPELSKLQVENITYRNQDNQVIDIVDLARNIRQKLKDYQSIKESLSSAQFALQMVQGAEKVRFCYGEPTQ
jgi:hypothetical protein